MNVFINIYIDTFHTPFFFINYACISRVKITFLTFISPAYIMTVIYNSIHSEPFFDPFSLSNRVISVIIGRVLKRDFMKFELISQKEERIHNFRVTFLPVLQNTDFRGGKYFTAMSSGSIRGWTIFLHLQE